MLLARRIELEDILNFGTKDVSTLSFLDSTLRKSLALCAVYHGKRDYLIVMDKYSLDANRAVFTESITIGTRVRAHT